MAFNGSLEYRQAVRQWSGLAGLTKVFRGFSRENFLAMIVEVRIYWDRGLRTERPSPFQASGLAQPDKGPSGIFPESLWEFY